VLLVIAWEQGGNVFDVIRSLQYPFCLRLSVFRNFIRYLG